MVGAQSHATTFTVPLGSVQTAAQRFAITSKSVRRWNAAVIGVNLGKIWGALQNESGGLGDGVPQKL